MSDDWSLKGKDRFYKEWDKDGFLKEENHAFPYENIETLRKKLIEDVLETLGSGGRISYDVIQIINKRFGVKE